MYLSYAIILAYLLKYSLSSFSVIILTYLFTFSNISTPCYMALFCLFCKVVQYWFCVVCCVSSMILGYAESTRAWLSDSVSFMYNEIWAYIPYFCMIKDSKVSQLLNILTKLLWAIQILHDMLFQYTP